jgi:hypothetical protein
VQSKQDWKLPSSLPRRYGHGGARGIKEGKPSLPSSLNSPAATHTAELELRPVWAGERYFPA